MFDTHYLYLQLPYIQKHVKTTYLGKQSIVFIRLFVFNNLIYVSYFLVDWAMNNAENTHVVVYGVHVVKKGYLY